MRLHHIGLVCADVADRARILRERHGFRLLGPPVADPRQRVKVAFVGTNSDVPLELIEPLDDTSPVARALAAGGGLNHLCYQVPDLAAAVARLRAEGGLLVAEPQPATAFAGRRIAFLYTRERQLVELLEEEAS
jgi:methylmalonyl-CoA/ethylmalonyl-CoA epimerase